MSGTKKFLATSKSTGACLLFGNLKSIISPSQRLTSSVFYFHPVVGAKVEHSVVNTEEMQRERTRDSLFMGAKVTVGASAVAVSTVIRNLSDGGVMIDSPTGIQKGQRVTTHLKNIGEVSGTVAWVHNGRAGVMFDEKIDPDEVRSSIKKPTAPVAQGTVLKPLTKGALVGVNVPGLGTFRGTIDWVEDKSMCISFERSLFGG